MMKRHSEHAPDLGGNGLRLAGSLLGLAIGFGILPAGPVEARAQPTYETTQVDQAPVPKKKVKCRMPAALRKKGGEITIRFLVKGDGSVDKISIVKFTDADLIDPVYEAYEKAEFNPGLKNGTPVETWVTVTEKAE